MISENYKKILRRAGLNLSSIDTVGSRNRPPSILPNLELTVFSQRMIDILQFLRNNNFKKLARGAHWAESPCPALAGAGRPSEPVWVIPAKGSGKRKGNRNTSIGITAFFWLCQGRGIACLQAGRGEGNQPGRSE